MKLPTNNCIGRLVIAAAFTMLTMLGSSVRADLYQYVLDGGTSTFTGTIGTSTYTNATWTLTNVFDPSTPFASNSGASFYETTTQLAIHSGGSTYTYNLGGADGLAPKAIAATNGKTFATAVFTSAGDISGGLFGGVSSNSFSFPSLGTYAVMSVYQGAFIQTTSGQILTSGSQNGVGSLTISQYGASVVPEPAEWAGLAMLGTGLGGLVVRARRRKVA